MRSPSRSPISLDQIIIALVLGGIIVLFRACTEKAHGAVCDAPDLSGAAASTAEEAPSFWENPPDWIVSPWCWVAVLLASLVRSATASAEKPPNTTECMAPMRAQASMAIAASGTIGM